MPEYLSDGCLEQKAFGPGLVEMKNLILENI